jgi:transcriptional regulator with XRE-family HTH domain
VREERGITQTQLAEQLGVTQVNVSRIERADDTQLSTLCRYVEGLGGRVELRAVFDDHSVPLTLPTASHPAPRS